MQLQTLNLKTFFIAFLWCIVVVFFLIHSYHFAYLSMYSYTDIFWWRESILAYSIAFCALGIIAGFSKREKRKRFEAKQREILHLFTKCSESDSSISLDKILSKTSFSEAETKGILEHLVEKQIFIPSFSEEQELIYKLTDKGSLEKYLKKIH